MAMKLSSTQWSARLGVLVTDPDGWNRQNFDASWAEAITENEFRARLQRSTSLTVPKWTPFWFETNSAWGKVDSPQAWAEMRANWNKGSHSMAPDEIYTNNRSWDRETPRDGDLPNFGRRSEHLGGKMTLGEFFDAHGMNRNTGA